jgi:hypothetical protein
VDDKAKVPVGEPHRPISTGVRGRQSIAPIDAELSSLDHDMKATSLTPSVALLCSIPDSVQQSFVRGQVTAFVNDSVTRPVRITNQTCHEHQEDSAKKPGKPKGSLKVH